MEANLADYLIVLLTAAIAFWGGMTWWEMHDAGKQTDRIIVADERIAKAMEDTLSQNIEIYRNDQRAWVGISGIQIPPLKPNEQITVQVPYINSGRSLALAVRTRSFATTSDVPIRPTEFITAHSSDPFRQPIVLFPGVPATSMSIVVPKDAATSLIGPVMAGYKHLYVLGEITYQDVFGRPHLTTFCGEYSPKTPSNLVACGEYNTAN